jgi:hypothetical protein
MALTFFNNSARAKDATAAVNFFTGTLTGSANTITTYAQYVDASNNIRSIVTFSTGGTTIQIIQKISGTDVLLGTVSGGALTSSTNYWFYSQLIGTNIVSSVYTMSGSVALGSVVTSVGPVATQAQQRGSVAWDSALVAAGSSIIYARLVSATYAVFESTPFPSITPLRGAQLSANTSLPIDLIKGYTVATSGDSAILAGSIAGKSGTRVLRSGATSNGGVQVAPAVEIGSATEVTAEGAIYPVNIVRGTYQIRLIDGSSNNVFTTAIPSLILNQWNSFSIPILKELLPTNISLIVEQTGTFPDEFFLSNLHLYHNTISWSASVDGGANWQKFIKVNDPNTGLHFSNPSTRLKIRGVAFSPTAWIEGFSVIPLYGYGGQRTFLVRFTTRDVRITGRLVGLEISRNQEARITGQKPSFVAYDSRISGGTSSNTTRDVRTKGQLSSNAFFTVKMPPASGLTFVVYDARLTGSNTSNSSLTARMGANPNEVATDRDSRITGVLSSLLSTSVRVTGFLTSNTSRDVRITAPAFTNVTRDVRVTGFSTTTTSFAVRTSGTLSSNRTQDVRTTGTATSSDTRDIRITGFSTSSRAQDARITGVAPSGGQPVGLLLAITK